MTFYKVLLVTSPREPGSLIGKPKKSALSLAAGPVAGVPCLCLVCGLFCFSPAPLFPPSVSRPLTMATEESKSGEALGFAAVQAAAKEAGLELGDPSLAKLLDAADPLAPYRKKFLFPPTEEGAVHRKGEPNSVYLCGNSLGLQPVTAKVCSTSCLFFYSCIPSCTFLFRLLM